MHDTLSAQLLREELEYEARRAAQEQGRERKSGPKVYCQIPGDMCLILDVYTGTIQLTGYEVYSRQGQNGLLNNVVLRLGSQCR